MATVLATLAGRRSAKKAHEIEKDEVRFRLESITLVLSSLAFEQAFLPWSIIVTPTQRITHHSLPTLLAVVFPFFHQTS